MMSRSALTRRLARRLAPTRATGTARTARSARPLPRAAPRAPRAAAVGSAAPDPPAAAPVLAAAGTRAVVGSVGRSRLGLLGRFLPFLHRGTSRGGAGSLPLGRDDLRRFLFAGAVGEFPRGSRGCLGPRGGAAWCAAADAAAAAAAAAIAAAIGFCARPEAGGIPGNPAKGLEGIAADAAPACVAL